MVDLNSAEVEVNSEGILVSASPKRPRASIEVDPTWLEGRVVDYNIIVREQVTSNEVGRLGITPYKRGFRDVPADKLHMYHLEVPKEFRNRGFGAIIFNVFKKYAVQSGALSVSIRVGNGGTQKFLESMGIEERYIHTHQFPNADEESVVVTTQSDFGRIKNTQSMTETAEKIEGVYTDRLFSD